ncbi:hypothetical protein GCM10022234_04860 [Aeromicrobium panaciterrae]
MPFESQIEELESYFDDPAGRPVVVPAAGNRPASYLLGASPDSGRIAGKLGLPYAFAHHIAPDAASDSIAAYRASFVPGRRELPWAILATRVVIADTLEAARDAALPSVLGQVMARLNGRSDPFPRDEDVPPLASLPRNVRAFIEDRLAAHVLGDPASARAQVQHLMTNAGADELMALTMIPDMRKRHRSFELLAAALQN